MNEVVVELTLGTEHFYVRLRTYAQYASMNEFTCSEHSVRIRRSKKCSTGNQPGFPLGDFFRAKRFFLLSYELSVGTN